MFIIFGDNVLRGWMLPINCALLPENERLCCFVVLCAFSILSVILSNVSFKLGVLIDNGLSVGSIRYVEDSLSLLSTRAPER
jgi:hypothetical protein